MKAGESLATLPVCIGHSRIRASYQQRSPASLVGLEFEAVNCSAKSPCVAQQRHHCTS